MVSKGGLAGVRAVWTARTQRCVFQATTLMQSGTHQAQGEGLRPTEANQDVAWREDTDNKRARLARED